MTDLISRADAIEAVRKKLQDWGGYAFEDYRRGLYEAQDILEALPSAELPKGDLISRADAIDALCHNCAYYTDAQCKTDSGYWCESGAMTREEAIYQIKQLAVLSTDKEIPKITEALYMAIEALSADAVPIVYCMDCAKSVPLDEHGALWKCKAHDRTTLRHSYCSHGERREP